MTNNNDGYTAAARAERDEANAKPYQLCKPGAVFIVGPRFATVEEARAANVDGWTLAYHSANLFYIIDHKTTD